MFLGLQHELDSEVGVVWSHNDAMLQYLHFRTALEGANLLFLLIYTTEMALKIAGLGLKE